MMTLSEKDFKLFKKWLRSHLNFGRVTVTFTKKDGTERVMFCTTKHDLVPYVEPSESKTERKTNDEACAVYDLEAKGWRSFRWDSVNSIMFKLGE